MQADYEKFDIRSGGGVPFEEAFTTCTDTPTLVIGLGGTGVDAILSVKRKLLCSLDPGVEADAGNRQLQCVPSNIAFLGLDSDISTLRIERGWASLSDEEIVFLQAHGLNIHQRDSIASQLGPDMDWLDYNPLISRMAESTGGIRQIGRLLLFYNIEQICSKIRRSLLTATALRTAIQDRKVNIFVLSGIGGGTGSGIFLDVAYLLRDIGRQLGANTVIHGYFFTPDLHPLMPSAFQTNYTYRNAYAALCELDYWMSAPDSNRHFIQQYCGSVWIDSAERPFNYCHIITSEDTEHRTLTYSDAIESVSNVIITLLFLKNTVAFDEIYENTFKFPSTPSENNLFRCTYYSAGASVLEIPYRAIMTLLTARMFELLLPSFECKTDIQSLSTDLERLQLAYPNLLKTIGEIDNAPLKNGISLSYDEICAGINPMSEFGNSFLQSVSVQLHENSQALQKKVKDDLSAYLGQIIASPQHGPGYAAGLLSPDNSDSLISAFKEYFLNSEKETVSAEEKQRALTIQAKEALYAVRNCNYFSRRRTVNAYNNIWGAWIENRINIMVHTEFCDVIQSLIIYLDQLSGLLSKLQDTLMKAADLFETNIAAITEEDNRVLSTSTQRNLPIVTATEFEKNNTQEIRTRAVQAASCFLEELSKISVQSIRQFSLSRESSTTGFNLTGPIIRAANQVFGPFLSRQLSLENAILREASAAEEKKKLQSILDTLEELASPLAAIDRIWRLQTDQTEIISIPDNTLVLAEKMSGISGAARLSMSTGRNLQLIQVSYGIPLYAFSIIDNLHTAFSKSTVEAKGVYLDKRWRPQDIFFKSEKNRKDLETLNLLHKIDNGYTANDEEALQLQETTVLRFNSLSLRSLPESLSLLSNLRILDISDTGITSIPESIGQLQKLESLILDGTELLSLPESIGQLCMLRKLSLHKSRISKLPESVGQLTNMEVLDLRRTHIKALPASLSSLSSLRVLKISSSPISSLPDEIGECSKLEWLSICNTGITELPESICKLEIIHTLNLSYTRLSTLPSAIQSMKKLKTLNISRTNISVLPEWIGELPTLEHLDLAGLTISELPESLALSNTQFISESCFPYEKPGINLYEARIINQNKSVFLETPELIRGLYNDQIPLQECKVIVLGDGGVGKTYTIQRMKNGGKKETDSMPYQTDETHGVKISDFATDFNSQSINIHFWDFGGQEILHSMHRCFLTEETCYIVMVRTRETEVTSRARYWLRTVASFASNSPVLLFINCWGNSAGDRAIDEPMLLREFSQIRNVVYCSSKEASDTEFVTKVMTPLMEMVVSSSIYGLTINRKWNSLLQAIRKQQRFALQERQNNYLSKSDYQKLCADNGITQDHFAGLLTIFNHLGLCFSYHLDANHCEMNDYKLLNPVWLTNALYAIIEEGSAHAQEGKISVDSIRTMLHNKAPAWIQNKRYRRTEPGLVYEDDECQYIIDVAESFNLCYRLEDNIIFFPALCKSNTPDEILTDTTGYTVQGEYRFCYNYLPDSIIHQLMIQCLQKGYTIRHCWLSGMELGRLEHHRAIIRILNQDTLQLMLYAKDEHPIYELLPTLRESIILISRSMNLFPKETVVDKEDTFPVLQLLKTHRNAQEDIVGNSTAKDYKVLDLLELYFDSWTIANMDIREDGIHIRPYIYHKVDKSNDIFRTALLDAYREKCAYCSRHLEPFEMQVDHILATKRKISTDSHVRLYLAELEKRGFDMDSPDYIENFFPSCGHCNRAKSNDIRDAVTLREYHAIALNHTPKVLQLMEKTKNT